MTPLSANSVRCFIFVFAGASLIQASAQSGTPETALDHGPNEVKRREGEDMDNYDRQHGIWGFVTSRSFGQIAGSFTSADPIEMASGAKVNISEAMARALEATNNCENSILSLGEGRSTFMYTLLNERKERLRMIQWMVDNKALGSHVEASDVKREMDCGLSNLHAVDVAYPKHGPNGEVSKDEKRPASKADDSGLDRYDLFAADTFIKDFPANYHGQLFQDLDIRNPDKTPKQFTFIISVAALNHVIGEYLNDKQMRTTVDKVIAHLASGGRLVITSGISNYPNAKGFYAYLKELKEKGMISDYSNPTKDSTATVIVK